MVEPVQLEAAAAWWANRKHWRYRLTELASRLSGRRLPRAYEYGIAGRESDNDDQDNARSCPPPDHRLTTPGLWAFELYTPARVEALRQGLIRARHPDFIVTSPERDPATWLANSRRRGSGGWLNLGQIHPPGTPSIYSLSGVTAPLPPGAKEAWGALLSISPSLSCMAVRFELGEDSTGALEAALRETYTTQVTRHRSGRSISHPGMLKRERVEDIRGAWRTAIGEWFRASFPGVFTADGEFEHLPICEVAYVSGTTPFAEDVEVRSPLTESTKLDFAPFTFDLSLHRGVTFSFDRDFDNNAHAFLSLSETGLAEVTAAALRYSGPNGQLRYLEDLLQSVFTRWSLLSLLDVLETRLHRIRDSESELLLAKRPKKLLKGLQRIAGDSADVAILSRELADFAASPTFAYRLAQFELRPLGKGDMAGEPPRLARFLADEIKQRAATLRTTDEVIRQLLSQQASFVGASETLRLAHVVGWFTLVSTVAALVSTTAAILALNGVQQWLAQWIADHLAN